LDYKKFRQYLKDKYKVEVAYLFIGFIQANNDVYQSLQKDGYILIFKEALHIGKLIKGNCDGELILQAMIDFQSYNKAVIVSGDGDFACLIKHLYQKNKLETVMVPNAKKYSVLIKKTAKERITSVSELKNKLEYKKSSTDKD
jgi:uncharacterized LabA/DUF88 family protein